MKPKTPRARTALLAAALLILLSLTAFATVHFLDANKPADPNDPASYALDITPVTAQDTPLVYTGEPLSVTIALTRGKTAFDCGLVLLVDGVPTAFRVAQEEATLLQSVTLTEPRTAVTLTFTPEGVPQNALVPVDVLTVLNPAYLLQSLDWLSYLPQHRGQALPVGYSLRSEVAPAQTRTPVSDVQSEHTDALDGQMFTLRARPDPAAERSPYYTSAPDGALNLWLFAAPGTGRWRVSIWVDNVPQTVFNGQTTLDMTLSDAARSRKITLTAPQAQWHHVSVVAVPLDRPDGYANVFKSDSEIWLVGDKATIAAEESRAAEKLAALLQSMDADDETRVTLPAGAARDYTFADVDFVSGVYTFASGDTILNVGREGGAPALRLFDAATGKLSEKSVPSSEFFMPSTPEERDRADLQFHGLPDANGQYQKPVLVTPYDQGLIVYQYGTQSWTKYDSRLNAVDAGQFRFADPNAFHAPVFNADGTRFAYVLDDGSIEYTRKIYTDTLAQTDRQLVYTLPKFGTTGTLVTAEVCGYREHLTLIGQLFDSYSAADDASNEAQEAFGFVNIATGQLEVMRFSGSYQRFENPNTRFYVQCDNAPIRPGPLDGSVEVFDAQKGALSRFTFQNPNESGYASVSETGQYIVSVRPSDSQSTTTVRVYNRQTGKLLVDDKSNASDYNTVVNEATRTVLIPLRGGMRIIRLDK
jgi:hypothetical protein